MSYIVTGVTGHTGAVVADALLAQGKRVRVVVRERSKGDRFAARGAEVAVADLGDAGALAQALTGAQGAYLLVPPNFAAPSFRTYQRQTADAIAAAAKQSGLPHLVLLSSIAAERDAGTGPIVGLHYLEGLLRALPQTRSTFIRAAYFMENLGGSLSMLEQGVMPSFTPANMALDMIATADIGKLAAQLLVEGASATSVVELSGGRYSPSDAAAAVSAIVGKPIAVAEAPLEAMVPTLTGFGMPTEVAELYREMTQAAIDGRLAFEGGHRRVQGTTPLATVLRQLLGKA
ncbi:MAG: NmrA family NAD(P)-binding protein [Nannocystaceae bacterium]|nr:NmrA family NAD(P)-binding protein [Nannocystaceae bacterium]